MWRRPAKWFWRGLLWLLLLLVLVTVPLLALMGSESGSRWLIEQGLGMQKALTMELVEGNMLTGFTAQNVHVHGKKFDLYIGRVLVRWRLTNALRAQVDVEDLQADKVRLVLTGPSSNKPVKLPRLVLPVRLVIAHAELRGAGIEKHGKYWGVDTLQLRGRWSGSRVTVQELKAHHAQGDLALRGAIRLVGLYDIDASGELTVAEFSRQGLGPVRLQLGRNLGSLALVLDSGGKLDAHAEGSLQTLTSDLPFSMNARWKSFRSPWLTKQELATTGGTLRAVGTLKGLQSSGDANFSGAQVPLGRYRWQGSTDWASAKIDNFIFNGLGGEAKVKANVEWHQKLDWTAQAQVQNLDLAKKWPALRMAVPPLSGTIESSGKTSAKGSAAALHASLARGETWNLNLKGQSWPWHLESRQSVQLSWGQVTRTLPGLGVASSQDGNLEFDGSINDYNLTLGARLVSARTPAGLWRLKAQGGRRQVEVEQLDYDGVVGSATFAGLIELKPVPTWEGALVMNDLQTGWLVPDWAGQFSGNLSTAGTWSAREHRVDLANIHVTGSLRDKPFAADGGLRLKLPLQKGAWPRFQADALQVGWGENRVHAEGGLTTGWDLQLEAHLPELALIDARVAGQLEGRASLEGEERRPSIVLQASGTNLAGFGAAAQTLSVDGRLASLGFDPGQLNLVASGLTIKGRPISSVNMTATGSRENHELTWIVKSPDADADGRLQGNFNSATRDWEGQLSVGNLRLPDMVWTLGAPATASWRMNEKTLHVSPHCWTSGEASLCNEDELLASPEGGHVRIRLSGLDASRLKRFLPEGLAWKGQIAGNGDANWVAGEQPELSLNLLSQGGQIALARDEGAPLELGYDLVALQAFIRPEDWRMRFDLQSQEMGSGYVDVTTDPRDKDHPLQGTAALQGMRLDVLQPFFPALASLSGRLSANGQVGGVVRHPGFWGLVELSDGQVVVRDAPVNLHDVGVQADIQGQHAVISGQLMSGEGKATLKGEVDWAQDWFLNLALNGKDLEFKQEPMLVAKADPDLTLAVVQGRADIKGKVRVPFAKINIQSLPEKAVPLSPDVEIVRVDEKVARTQLATAMRSWLINADIELLLGDNVNFDGFGVIGKLGGAVHLQQQGKRGLQATGEVELDKEARYEAYGQKLQIRRGRLLFAGPITQPGVDVEAVKEVESKTVGIRVAGRANAPEVSFFSDSALSQEEIISYMVLGRPLYKDGQLNTEGGGNANLALAAAAIKLGAKQGQGLASDIGGIFGISDVSLGAEGTADDTQFTVSGYLNPKLYLSYGVGVFTPVNTVKVRYTINSKLYLQALSSLENAIDLYYSFKF